jgi:hypothetical protein
MVEDKSSATTTTTTNTTATGCHRSYSWWDIQDGNAKLPLKETSPSDLQTLLFPSLPSPQKKTSTSYTPTDTATKAAKGALKLMGKAMASAIGEDTISHMEGSTSPNSSSSSNHKNGGSKETMVAVLVVKLLDLVKLHDEYALKHNGGGHIIPKQQHIPRQPHHHHHRGPTAPPVASSGKPLQQSKQPQQHQQPPTQPPPHTRPVTTTTASAPQASGDLMDFGEDAPPPSGFVSASSSSLSRGLAKGRNTGNTVLHHAHSSPALGVGHPNETRAQRLKREQEERMKTRNRVWDDIDQRWVEVPSSDSKQDRTNHGNLGAAFGTTTSTTTTSSSSGRSTPSTTIPGKKEVGIKLDMSNAAGKSVTVQRAMSERVNEMEANRQKAVAEVKQREAIKKQREEEEDTIRQQLEPKIKAWAEEHGKKKQLTALLGSLHTILWTGAKWKQVSIGDVLDAKKCKKIYFKATLVVHPDKTHDLPPDQRFLAKRIFDALTQAKTIYDQQKEGR